MLCWNVCEHPLISSFSIRWICNLANVWSNRYRRINIHKHTQYKQQIFLLGTQQQQPQSWNKLIHLFGWESSVDWQWCVFIWHFPPQEWCNLIIGRASRESCIYFDVLAGKIIRFLHPEGVQFSVTTTVNFRLQRYKKSTLVSNTFGIRSMHLFNNKWTL